MKNTLIILSVVLLTVGLAYAGPIAITADEPTENKDGTPLTDLTEIVFYYRLAGGAWQECDREPATAPTGGGVTEGYCVITESHDGNVEFMAVAVDDVGNESDDSELLTKNIDNQRPAACSIR